jgi:hypothetical protein
MKLSTVELNGEILCKWIAESMKKLGAKEIPDYMENNITALLKVARFLNDLVEERDARVNKEK